jgi:hypothetical protein
MSETKWQEARSDEFPMMPDDELASDDPLEPHPLSEMFPLMEGTELAELAADIAKYGLREPIMLHEGKILDGRNRYRACRLAGVPISTCIYVGDDPGGYVWSANFHRRHLNNEGKRKAIAAYDKLNPASRPMRLRKPSGLATRRLPLSAILIRKIRIWNRNATPIRNFRIHRRSAAKFPGARRAGVNQASLLLESQSPTTPPPPTCRRATSSRVSST